MTDVKYLPEAVLQQIFVRMPTRLLAQLRCVSMRWNKLISDPEFMKLRSRRMIFLPILPFYAIDNTVTGAPSMIKLHFPLSPNRYKEVTVVGSLNGVVLLVLKYCNVADQYDHDLILYNPLSGKFKMVSARSRSSEYVYGFGYGTTVDDLKIVGLRGSKSFEVFSLKTWSWSPPSLLSRHYISYLSICSSSGTFANGFLYWMAESVSSSTQMLLVHDIKNLVFSWIEVPYECASSHLGTYNGQLCMLCFQRDGKGFELLQLNKNGFGKPRTTICSFKWAGEMFCMLDSKMLSFLDDGKLLMLKSPEKLLIFDMFKESYIEVNALTNFRGVGRQQAITYVESFTSPSKICSFSI